MDIELLNQQIADAKDSIDILSDTISDIQDKCLAKQNPIDFQHWQALDGMHKEVSALIGGIAKVERGVDTLSQFEK